MKRAGIAVIKEAVKLAIAKRLPFYAYALPETETVKMSVSVNSGVSETGLESGTGFIFFPYKPGDRPALFIKDDLVIRGEKELHALYGIPPRRVETEPRPNTALTYGAYCDGVGVLLEKLRSGAIKKAVYSRTCEYGCPALEYAPDWFGSVVGTYPSAFRFIISVPGTATWMGATPELLLEYDGGRIATMALAATRANSEKRGWSIKEEEEQQIVAEYIKGVFLEAGIAPEVFPREELQAGPVTHLCNRISAKEITFGKARELLAKLHPTPAVCGVPVSEAAASIADAEKRSRRYYSGYLGPVEKGKSFSLFVNLRSMELFSDRVQLYVGGGLTAGSEIRSEWEETEHKAATLLSCIDQKDEYYHR